MPSDNMNRTDQLPISPMANPAVSLGQAPGAYTEDLGWILHQFSARTGATEVAVIAEYFDGRPREIIFQEGPTDVFGDAVSREQSIPYSTEEKQRCFIARNEDGQVFIQVAYPPQPPGEIEKRRMILERLHPVLCGYFKLWLLHRSTSRRLQTITAALSQVDFGVIMLDHNAMIMAENPAATAILDEGSVLHRCRGSVCGTRVAESIRLRVAIDDVLTNPDEEALSNGSPPLVLFKKPRHQAPLIAAIIPVDPGSGGRDRSAVIHLFDSAGSINEMIGPICQWFKLSTGETRLVKKLVAGRSVQEIAAEEEVKEDSIRTYLKSVFRKTAARSQADLIRLMLMNPVRLQPEERGLKTNLCDDES